MAKARMSQYPDPGMPPETAQSPMFPAAFLMQLLNYFAQSPNQIWSEQIPVPVHGAMAPPTPVQPVSDHEETPIKDEGKKPAPLSGLPHSKEELMNFIQDKYGPFTPDQYREFMNSVGGDILKDMEDSWRNTRRLR